MQANPNEANKLFKKGQDALKTSFLSFKFSPDFLSAVSYFSDAARAYKKLRLFKESVKAFEEAIKCNKQLLEGWAEGQNWHELAEIYFYELKDFNSGWRALQNSSLAFKLAGKFTSGIKIYTDNAQKFLEKGEYASAIVLLKTAHEDCLEQTHDELIRISLEETFGMYLDALCQAGRFQDAVGMVENYIKVQKGIKGEAKHKVSKNYVKLAMLRCIIDEVYMADSIMQEMFGYYDSSCSDDIDDLRKLIKAFKEGNKKDFTYLMTYAYSLFQNNLLKALRTEFEKVCARLGVNNNSNNIINIVPGGMLEQLDDINETKADSEFANDETIVRQHAEDYL
jgi:tetratricopeptide (TPR) repeat protein